MADAQIPKSDEVPPVTVGEVEIVVDFIRRFRAHASKTQAISAATVAIGLPALGQTARLELVLEAMEARGLLARADEEFDHIVGGRRWREAAAFSTQQDGGG